MRPNTTWRRVRRGEPCPICERPDWCMVTGPAGNPSAAICARIESGHPVGDKGAGWLHRMWDEWQPLPASRTLRVLMADPPAQDFGALATRYQAAASMERVERLADGLGLSVASLRALDIGWSHDHGAWTFPMMDVAGRVRGIRLRLPSGRKLSIRGGREGLFIPRTLPETTGTLLVCEGPTDCAALLDLGLAAIGRPSCTGGAKLIVELVQQRHVGSVVIVADGDEPGQRGAETLANVLMAYCMFVRIITPPVKDMRQWRRQGATRDDVQALIEAAADRRLPITVRKGVRRGR